MAADAADASTPGILLFPGPPWQSTLTSAHRSRACRLAKEITPPHANHLLVRVQCPCNSIRLTKHSPPGSFLELTRSATKTRRRKAQKQTRCSRSVKHCSARAMLAQWQSDSLCTGNRKTHPWIGTAADTCSASAGRLDLQDAKSTQCWQAEERCSRRCRCDMDGLSWACRRHILR